MILERKFLCEASWIAITRKFCDCDETTFSSKIFLIIRSVQALWFLSNFEKSSLKQTRYESTFIGELEKIFWNCFLWHFLSDLSRTSSSGFDEISLYVFDDLSEVCRDISLPNHHTSINYETWFKSRKIKEFRDGMLLQTHTEDQFMASRDKCSCFSFALWVSSFDWISLNKLQILHLYSWFAG